MRLKLGGAHTALGEYCASRSEFDKARAEFQAALPLLDSSNRSLLLCQWAAREFRANNPSRAEELLQQALAEIGQPLVIAFNMVVHAVKMPLDKALKTRFESEFKQLLANPPVPAAVAALASRVASEHTVGGNYTGKKALERKVFAFIDKAGQADFTETQLQTICEALKVAQAVKALRAYFGRGQKRFPANPRFFLAEAEYQLSAPRRSNSPPRVAMLLEKVRALASSLPPPDREAILARVKTCEDKLHGQNPFGGLFGQASFGDMFSQLFDDDDDDDDDDRWEDDF